MIAIMSQAVIDRLSKLAHRTQELAAGDVMFRAGDPVRSLFLVVAGGLRLVRSLPHGTQLILQRAGPGTNIGDTFAGFKLGGLLYNGKLFLLSTKEC